MSYKKQELFILQELLFQPWFLVGSVLLHIQVARRMSYNKQELFILQELRCSSSVFGGVRVVTYISSTASVLEEAGTVYPSGAPVFIPGFWWDPCCYIYK